MAARVGTYYSKLLVNYMMPKLRLMPFADKRPLPEHMGTSVIWARYSNPTADATALTQGTAPSALALSSVTVSAVLRQYGYVFGVSDLLEMTSVDSEVERAVAILGDKAAMTLDTVVRNDIQDATTNFIELVSGAGTVGAVSALGSAYTFQEPVLRQAVWSRLKRLNIEPFEDGNYVGVIHPLNGRDLIGSAGWQNWFLYVNPEAAYKGEMGRLHATRLIESGNIYTGSAVATSATSISAAYNFIFGKQFYGATEFDGGVHVYVKGPNEFDKSDPINQYSTVGYKATFASRLLNPSAGVIVPGAIAFL